MTKTYNDLLLETQPQVITSDTENDANLAHIERLTHLENPTEDEEKILNLLLLLSEQFENKQYPMKLSFFESVLHKIQSFIFRW